MTKKEELLKEIQTNKEFLLKVIKEGDTVYTSLTHVSRSGMYRVINLFVVKDNQIIRISWSVADVTGYTYNKKHEGVGISGCGMDMGYAIVYDLGRVLFPTKDKEKMFTLRHQWL